MITVSFYTTVYLETGISLQPYTGPKAVATIAAVQGCHSHSKNINRQTKS